VTREEEVARLAEIEARPTAGASDKIKAAMRDYFERKWALEDQGVPDLMQIKIDRMVARANKESNS
jgi:hypothetical protein